jgi:NADP-dependent 3-hydroxy acid dehydrogenase YdfG
VSWKFVKLRALSPSILDPPHASKDRYAVRRTKLAIVTGATSGIGAAIAQTLGAAGTRVFLVGRSARKLTAAARRIPPRQLAGTALADLRSLADIKRLLGEVSRSFPRVNMLVHCAGEYQWSEPGSLDCENLDLMFEVNVRAPYLLTQGLTPLLERAQGQVIFLNSSVVNSAGQGVAAYKATQHAVQGFTDSLRQDLNRRGIRVSSLFPGRTATPRMRRIYAREGKPYKPNILLSAHDVAQLVLALSELPPRVEITDVHLRSLSSY